MTWSYNVALSDAKDQVRLLIGDTDDVVQLLQDEEIEYFIATEANTRMASSRAAMAVASKYTRKADKSVGDLKIAYGDRAQAFMDLSKELKTNATVHQIPTAGGITVNDTQVYESNEAIRHSAVKRGMHDFTRTPTIPNTEGS